jgi:hypothetical protein
MTRLCQLLELRSVFWLYHSRFGRSRAHSDSQTLATSVHVSDMTAQFPRVYVYHLSVISSTVSTEDLALAELKCALHGPVVFVRLVPTRHGVDGLS